MKRRNAIPLRISSLGWKLLSSKSTVFQKSSSADALSKLNSGRHRDALSELLDLYASLGLEDDEDLLVRAERRDLPEKFQKSWSSRWVDWLQTDGPEAFLLRANRDPLFQ